MQTDAIYVGHDATIKMEIRDRASGSPTDLVELAVDRAQFTLAGITLDSDAHPQAFDWVTEGAAGRITINLTGLAYPAGSFGARLVIFHPEKPNGVVVADGFPVCVGERLDGEVPAQVIAAGQVKLDAADAAGYLPAKLVAGDNVSIGVSGGAMVITGLAAPHAFRGAKLVGSLGVTGDPDQTPALVFDEVEIDAGGFTSPAKPGVFTIPEGVSLVCLSLFLGDCECVLSDEEAEAFFEPVISRHPYVEADFPVAYAHREVYPGEGGLSLRTSIFVTTGPLEVGEGDAFHCRVNLGDPQTLFNVYDAHFCVEVLQ